MASTQSRSQNGSSRPGGATSKNTFQKMLELEKRNKIERMSASLETQQDTYRRASAPYQTPALYVPSTVPSPRQTLNPRQPLAIPAALQQITKHNWAEQPMPSKSIDEQVANAGINSQSISTLDTIQSTSRQHPEETQMRQRDQSVIERERLLHGLDLEGRLPLTSPDNNTMVKHKEPCEPAAKSLTAFNIFPESLAIRVPRERTVPRQPIPQLDGSYASKPSFSQVERQRFAQLPTPESANVLQRHESSRSSICRSPSWSVTHGPRGRLREEERRTRKKAAKEAKLAMEKEAKATKEREERDAKEVKVAREKHEKEEKARQEKEEKEREREAKTATKQQKKLSKPLHLPKKLTKNDRSNSLPIVPSVTPKHKSSPRQNSFQSTDSSVETSAPRKFFQAKAAPPDNGFNDGFIGGLKLARLKNPALNAQTGLEGKQDIARPVTASRRFDLDGSDEENDDEMERDRVRNAYQLALNDSSGTHSPTIEVPSGSTSRRTTMGDFSLSESPQDIVDYLGKPKSPFYQLSQANNSFVDEIFHTIQNRHSNSSTDSKIHPLRSNPSRESERIENRRGSDNSFGSDGFKGRERATGNETNYDRTQIQHEPSYETSSFAARMAKKSGSLEKIPPKDLDYARNAVEHHRYSDHQLRPPPQTTNSAISIRADRLAAAVGTDGGIVSAYSRKHQVTVLEAAKTKTRSMLIEELIIGDEDQNNTKDGPTATETKRDTSKTRSSRSSSRETSWFRRSSNEDSKPSIQERRRSRGRGSTSIDIISTDKPPRDSSTQSSIDGETGEKPRSGRRNSISPTISSFKAAAKAAFSKYGPAAPSSKANLPSSPLNRPASSEGGISPGFLSNDNRRQTLPSSVTMPSIAKADKILGENLSSVMTNDRRTSLEQHRYGSTSSSVTTKGSDEEVSSPEDVEETSNITTPTLSRPTSKKEQLLTIKSISTLPGGRFHDEFSPGFLSALDRGQFDMSDVEDMHSPVEEAGSIAPTPIASPTEMQSSAEGRDTRLNLERGALIADAIARVTGFALPSPKDNAPKQEKVVVVSAAVSTKNEELLPAALSAKGKAKEPETTPPASLSIRPNPSQTEDTPTDISSITRQASIKSASMTNLPSLANPSSSPNLDFSFLPPLKHESLARPPRASTSESLQAIAASVLGPPSSKTSKGTASSGKKSNGIALSSAARGTSLPPPQNRLHQEGAILSPIGSSSDGSTPSSPNTVPPSIKASWLAAISKEKENIPSLPSSNPSSTSIPTSTTKELTSPQPRRLSFENSPTSTFTSADSKSLPNQLIPKPSNGTAIAIATGITKHSLAPAHGSNFRLTSNLITHPTGGSLGDPYAKCFLICCGCKRFHDLPSKVYENLLLQGGNHSRAKEVGGGGGEPSSGGKSGGGWKLKSRSRSRSTSANGGEAGKVTSGSGSESGKVVCQWCEHSMTSECCESWAMCVKLVERLS